MRMQEMPEILIKSFTPFMKLAVRTIYCVSADRSTPETDIASIPPKPILLFHSKKDDQVPVNHLYDLYDACGEQAELWISEDAEHIPWKGDGTGPEDEWYRTGVLEFLEKAINSYTISK